MHRSVAALTSLRYRRPYWMLFIQNTEVDNWRIYEVIHEPQHQRTEMMYQAWLGGLDRPYVRPRCMAKIPLWLQKKRHEMEACRLQNPQSPLEKYVIEWNVQFDSFGGKKRPTFDDLHAAFDLVERPLDLSYALKLMGDCVTRYSLNRLDSATFQYFFDACARVGRLDCIEYALEHAEELAFPTPIDARFVTALARLKEEGTPKPAAAEEPEKEDKEKDDEALLRELEEEERKLRELLAAEHGANSSEK